MKTYKILIILIFLLEEHSRCDLRQTLHLKLKELAKRSKEMYGEKTKKTFKLWELESGDAFSYPRGDKHKLREISNQWLDYYSCCGRDMCRLTASGGRASASVYVYEGSVARLPCGLCVAPDMLADVTWVFSETLSNLTFEPIEDLETAVLEDDGTLTIYNVKEQDGGVYRCEVGDSVGGLVVLEVTDTDAYNVVKPSTSRGPYSSPARLISHDLVLFSSWTRWSECSRCGKVGRRRRYGACHVRLVDNDRVKKQLSILNKTLETAPCHDNIWYDARSFLEEFPRGIACRSRYLPQCVASVQAVRERRNEIMIAMCKVPCKNVRFTVVSQSGRVLESANNSAGVYSVLQRVPPQPPPPVRDVLYVEKGSRVVLRCPGTTLRDIPVSWRVGTKHVVPRSLGTDSAGRAHINARDMLIINPVTDDDSNLYRTTLRDIPVSWRVGTKHVVPRSLGTDSAGRAHINARDMLVINSVTDDDSNLYSCWQADVMAGAVRLTVWTRRIQWNGRVALVVMVALAAILLRRVEALFRDMQRRADFLFV